MFRCSFTGNLGADPESKFSSAGNQMVQVRVAVNTRRKNGDEWEDHTDWIRVRAMGRLAGSLERARKGDRILVAGALETGEYIGRDDQQKRLTLDVWADEVELLTARPRDQVDGAAGNGAAASTTSRAGAPADLGDIPF